MNILIIGLNIMDHALTEAGNNIFHCHLSHPMTVSRLLRLCAEENFSPDMVLYVDNGNLPLILDPESFPFTAIYYSIDSYCNPWHFSYAHGFDLTLVAQKDFLGLFQESGINAVWFPLFCQNESGDSSATRDIPVAFVGTLGHKNNPARRPFLEQFRKLQPLAMLSGDFAPVFGRSQIVLNQTAFGEINFRCFEAMGCGAALLMEKCGNGFSELFTEGENILPAYERGNAVQAAQIAATWLARPELLGEVAAAGREHVEKNHSARARAATFSGLAADLISHNSCGARLGQIDTRKVLTRAAYGMLAAELTDPGFAVYRDFFLNLAR